MTVKALDYTNLSTWHELDALKMCLRISDGHAGAFLVTGVAYQAIVARDRAKFFFKCEKENINGPFFFQMYKHCCDGNMEKFISGVMKPRKIMLKTLDYTQLSTWERLDCSQTCSRIAENDAEALLVAQVAYKAIAEGSSRAKFFFKCEKHKIKGTTFLGVYKYVCGEDMEKFISGVIKPGKTFKKTREQKSKDGF